jgi:hypothetical protein
MWLVHELIWDPGNQRVVVGLLVGMAMLTLVYPLTVRVRAARRSLRTRRGVGGALRRREHGARNKSPWARGGQPPGGRHLPTALRWAAIATLGLLPLLLRSGDVRRRPGAGALPPRPLGE